MLCIQLYIKYTVVFFWCHKLLSSHKLKSLMMFGYCWYKLKQKRWFTQDSILRLEFRAMRLMTPRTLLTEGLSKSLTSSAEELSKELLSFFKTRFHYATSNMELLFLSPLPSKSWDDRCVTNTTCNSSRGLHKICISQKIPVELVLTLYILRKAIKKSCFRNFLR